jgi:hypothetical protein
MYLSGIHVGHVENPYLKHWVDKVAVKFEYSNAALPVCHCLSTERCVRASIQSCTPSISASLCPCFYMHCSSGVVVTNRCQVIKEKNVAPWLGNPQVKVNLRLIFVQQWKVTCVQFS